MTARFWSKVRKSDGCWEWTAARNRNGYGMFWNGTRMVLAHRFAWVLAHGPIPAGQEVCHSCDNPACQRDEHHFLGTHQDNVTDMVEKGRQRTPRGLDNPNATIDFAAVEELRRQHAAGATIAQVARAFGVSWRCAKSMVTGRTRRTA